MLGALTEVVYANRDEVFDLFSVGVNIDAHSVMPDGNADVPLPLGAPSGFTPQQRRARQQQAQNGHDEGDDLHGLKSRHSRPGDGRSRFSLRERWHSTADRLLFSAQAAARHAWADRISRQTKPESL